MAFLVVSLSVLAYYVLSPVFGVQSSVALHRRVQDLENRLAARIAWGLSHRSHLQAHIRDAEVAGTSSDGRKHLLSAPSGVSRLAEALAPDTGIAEFDDHYLCGNHDISEAEAITKKIALAAVTYRAPKSTWNSMESWRKGGLLDVVDEKMIFLNAPTQEDRDIAQEFDFDVYTTEEYGGNIMAGPSIAYLSGNASADYILFMEKDFVLNSGITKAEMMRELYTGVQHLARGVDAYRLRGKSDWPAEGMPNCCEVRDPPTCPYNSNWKSAGYFGDHMNWLLVFCDPNIMEHSNGRLVQCTSEPNAPTSYCYTSGETNWSNNPIMFRRTWFNEKVREIALRDFTRNNMFEFNVMMEWLTWKPPAIVCMSWQGIFTHYEVDQ